MHTQEFNTCVLCTLKEGSRKLCRHTCMSQPVNALSVCAHPKSSAKYPTLDFFKILAKHVMFTLDCHHQLTSYFPPYLAKDCYF